MNRYFRIVVFGAATAATLLTTFEVASARDRYWRDRHHGHYHNGRWVAAGVLGGLAAGVIVGSALAEPRVIDEGPVYGEPEYGEPEAENLGPIEDYDNRPVDQRARADDARPQDGRIDGEQMMNDGQLNDEARGEDYFPERPQPHRRRQVNDDTARSAIEPWSEEWLAYCAERYRSFNARSGTYKGDDGESHFCTAG